MGNDEDWFAGYEPERPEAPPRKSEQTKPAPASPKGWKPGERRLAVLAVCCASCGSLEMTRQNTYGSAAYWRCESCKKQQKEPVEIRPNRATVLPG
jgi:hypothetical protein